jgi:gentisate 1,2-dioxygenase
VFFILWIGIASIGLLNLLTAVFIDALHDKTREAKEKARQVQKQKKMQVPPLVPNCASQPSPTACNTAV